MCRLFADRLYGGDPAPDDKGRIRIDDWEMGEEIQAEVDRRWQEVNTENFSKLADLEGYESSFLRLFGFGLEGVDYSAETDPATGVPSVE